MRIQHTSPRTRTLVIAAALLAMPAGALLAGILDGADRHRLAQLFHGLALGSASHQIAEPAPVVDSFAPSRTH